MPLKNWVEKMSEKLVGISNGFNPPADWLNGVFDEHVRQIRELSYVSPLMDPTHLSARRPDPDLYISPLVDGTECTAQSERRFEKLERLGKYTADAQLALSALLKSIRATVRKTRFTGRSKPAKRAMAKLAARRCR
jgi:hypothetical protein